MTFKTLLNKTEEVGTVSEVKQSLVYAKGLPGAKPLETVVFETGEEGLIISLSPNYLEILLLSDSTIKPGTKVARTGKSLEIPVGKEYLGSIISPLGTPFEDTDSFKSPRKQAPVEVITSGIEGRKVVDTPFDTGVALVDNLVPLGKGQRELVIGDRKTGKTSFLLQAMLKQAREGSICIYTAIAKRKVDIKKVENFIAKHRIQKNCLMIASNASDPLGLIHLTPYSAMTIAEHFRDSGFDVLLILDDLTTHAKYYREISLLGKRFPGRNSYPGDIFYAYARLLERGGNFATNKGPKAITCLPVAETIEGDIEDLIQTNLMSMTDGHIYFDKALFAKGRRPPINHFVSVTRVGRQTQNQLESDITRELMTFFGLYEKTQEFLHFGAELSDSIKNTIILGDQLTDFFNQRPGEVIPANLQIFIITMIWSAYWQSKSVSDARTVVNAIDYTYRNNKNYQDSIDKLISSATNYNHLIGLITSKADHLVEEANKYYAQHQRGKKRTK